ESRDRPLDRARPGRVAAVDRRLHPAVAHARGTVVERAVQLAHVDSRDLDLPRRAAAGGGPERDRDPGAQLVAQDSPATLPALDSLSGCPSSGCSAQATRPPSTRSSRATPTRPCFCGPTCAPRGSPTG